MASKAASYVVPAAKRHTATVVFLHGLGDTGQGWMGLAANWRKRGLFEEVKFVFPNAPLIPVTVNFGMAMPGWYDIVSFDDSESRSDDEAGILRTRDYLRSLLRTETDETGIPLSRMVIGGFSQGGAISLFTGMTSEQRLGGFFGLSSYLLLGKKMGELIPSGVPNQAAPVFMGHGDSDPLVKYAWGVATSKKLQELGWKVDFRTYEGLDHGADPKEMDDLEQYLKDVLPPSEVEPLAMPATSG